MSVDLTRYLLFGYVNILRDVMCDCQKKKKVQWMIGFLLLRAL